MNDIVPQECPHCGEAMDRVRLDQHIATAHGDLPACTATFTAGGERSRCGLRVGHLGGPLRDYHQSPYRDGAKQMQWTDQAAGSTPNSTPAQQPRVTTACAALHTDGQGNTVPCPGYPNADAVEPEPDDYDEDTRPEAPSRKEANPALPVQPDPRQPAYDAVYEYIRNLGAYLPPDPVHRNAIIWRAVSAALDATPVGRCVSSHCVEGDHILPLGEWETP